MAAENWYQNNFNGGQVTRKLDGRTDLPQYNKSCKVLQNMYVLSQGGVQSRSGTKYMTEAVDGDSRLLPFQFSRDESYVFEVNPSGIRVFDDTGVIGTISGVPWTAAEIKELKYAQTGDLIYIVCGTVEPYVLTRATSTPSFTLLPVVFDFPPMLDVNTDESHKLRISELTGQFYLESDTPDAFHALDVGKEFSLDVPRSPLTITQKIATGWGTAVIDSSFSNWKITTGGTWNGRVVVQRKIGAVGTWEDYVVVGDTTNINASNFTVSSPAPEGKDVELRVSYIKQTNNLPFTIITTEPKQSTVVQVTGFVNSQKLEVDPLTYVGSLSTGAGVNDTSLWSEGAFSDDKGYPTTVTFHENRLCFCGTNTEPATVYLSESDNYMTFRVDNYATSALKVKPITNEPATWMISKGDLMLGTRGSVITIQANDKKDLKFDNLSAVESNAFGGSYIQAIKTNETVVYIESGSKKLREIFYSDEEQSIVSRDLTILSDDISGVGGFKELTLQKIPDQIVWGLRADGKLAGLTYERSQDIYGWHVHDFGGPVSSIAVRQSPLVDDLWVLIDREGTFMVERMGTREFGNDLLDTWFVDSGVKSVLPNDVEVSSITGFMDGPSEYIFGFDKVAHGLVEGDKISFSDMSDDFVSMLGDYDFEVANPIVDYFNIRYADTTKNVNPVETGDPTYLDLTITGDSASSGRYVKGLDVDAVTWTKPGAGTQVYQMFYDGNLWQLVNYDTAVEFPAPVSLYQTEYTGKLNPVNPDNPPDSDWVEYSGSVPATFAIAYFADAVLSGSYKVSKKVWDGLDHLEGKDVQVVGDGSYSGTYTVSGGEVEIDEFYNQTVIGLRFLKIVQPMLVESKNYNSFSDNKNVMNASIRFSRSFGGYSGVIVQTADRMGELPLDTIGSTFPLIDNITVDQYPITLRTFSDPIGTHIGLFSGDKELGFNDTWSVLKSLYVVGDLPMPFELLGVGMRIGG